MNGTYKKGIIKVLSDKDRSYYTAEEVMELVGVSRSKAYELIRRLRQEMINQGNLTPDYPGGKIPKAYFNRRCGIEEMKGVNQCTTENVRAVGVI